MSNNGYLTLEQIEQKAIGGKRAVYHYAGKMPYLKYRWKDDGKGDKAMAYYTYIEEEKIWKKDLHTDHTLYKLPELLQAIKDGVKRIFIVEGEKDVDNLRAQGEIATTSGAWNSWKDEFKEYFKGYTGEVIILPDQDEPDPKRPGEAPNGQKYGEAVFNSLTGIVPLVYRVNVTQGKDISDFLQVKTMIDLEGLISTARASRINQMEIDNLTDEFCVLPAAEGKPLPPRPAGAGAQEPEKKVKKNIALTIFEAIKDREELKTSWDGDKLYILTKDKKWSLIEGNGELELLSKIYDITGMAGLNKDAIKTVKQLLKIKHYKEGKEHREFFKRTANIQDSIIYNGGNFTVNIKPDSWEIGEHEALFLENKNQVQQEKPDVNYKEKNLMDLLKDIVPTKTDDELLLMAIYITSLFIPDIPKPALNIEGDHGSGKTCIARVIKEIYDPGEVKSVNKINTEDLCLNFAVNDFMVLNNLSKINTSLSDILCCIIDGETISKRKLYEDDSLFVKKVKGTFAITSISVGKKNADLLDRMLKINLQRIEDEDRKTEKKIGRHFRGKKPFILSSIFNILSEAMNYIEDIEEKEISRFRLADWYMWSLSIARALDAEEKFKSIIEQQKKMMLEDQLQDDEKIEILYNYLMEQVTDRPFEISSKELKTQLNEQSKNSKPLFTGHIGYFLKRVIVTFKGYGFNIENIRKAGGKRIWRVTKISDRVTNSDKPENTSLSLKENHIPQGKKSISDRVTDDFFSLEKKEIEKRNLPLIEDNRNPISSEKSLSLCHSCKKVSDSNNIISDKLSDKLISSSVTQKSLSLIKCSDCKNFTGENKTAVYICPVVNDRYYPTQEHYCNKFQHKTGPAEVLQIEDNKRRYNEALMNLKSGIDITSCKNIMRETRDNLRAMGIEPSNKEIMEGFEICKT